MIGYKSAYWKIKDPIYMIVFDPKAYRDHERFNIIELKSISRSNANDFFEYTKKGSCYKGGIVHKGDLFRSKQAAYNKLRKLVKQEYEESLKLIKSLIEV
jgi:hypothetical protein